MYEPSRDIMSFCIAGFSHYDGPKVFDELKIGTRLELALEPDNPYDAKAVAIRFQGVKLGYIPAKMNFEVYQLMFFGHADLFECFVVQVDPETHPESQVRVRIDVVDARA